jgi:hypothetical protein
VTKPGPSVTSGADTQPGSDSLFPSGFGGGSLIRTGGVGTAEIADASVAAADLNLPSVAAALAARTEFATCVRADQVVDSATYGNGTTDATAHIAAKLAALPTNGSLYIPTGTYKVTSTLTIPSGCEVFGFGIKGTVILANSDITVFNSPGGTGVALRDVKIQNNYATGARTKYDLDFSDPTKLTIERVEIALPGNNTGAGGIYFHRVNNPANDGTNCMIYMRDVWIRNGTILVDGPSDSKVEGGWTWSNGTGQPGAFELKNASNWTIINHDVVPSANAGYLMSAEGDNLAIIGGMIDGSYTGIQTGWGFKATAPVRGMSIIGMKFWNIYLGAISVTDMRRSVIHGCIFSANNRGDNSYPDIQLASAVGNTISGNTFSAPNSRTNLGLVLTEDSNCSDNIFVGNVVEVNSAIVPNGHYYNPTMISDVTSTLVKDNRPESAWPQGIAPEALIPTRLATVTTIAASAWPAAGQAIFQRISVPQTGSFRYLNMQIDTQSGNFQVGICKLSGSGLTTFTRLMTNGVTATPASALSGLRVDLGAQKLRAGEYAVFVWFDNTTAQTRYASNSMVPATRCSATITGLTSRTVADAVTTSGSATVTSATAAFTSTDVGRSISGTGIPAGATIASVTNGTTAILSANATATGSSVSITVTGVPSTGTLAWTSNTIVGSLSIERDI